MAVRLPKIDNKFQALEYKKFAGYNTRDSDISAADDDLTGGQNVDISPDNALSKRLGHTLYGNYIGSTTGVLDLITHEPASGTAEVLAAYDTSLYRYVAGTWTALTSVTLTTNLRGSHAHFPINGKTYYVNGTDNVVKYTSGSSGDQTDASFKKGTIILHFKNRLLTSIGKRIWYTDLGVDTFSSNNYLDAPDTVTAMVEVNNRWLTFTKKEVRFTQNFTFNGVAAGPEQFIPLPGQFGAIYERTVAKVGSLVYFLGQNAEGIAAVYVTDGQTISNRPVSDVISPDFNDLAPASLTNACATAWGKFYRLSITPSGQTTNTKEYLLNTVTQRWLPPYTNNLGGFSCYTTVETSGRFDVYAGCQGSGEIYKLNQVDYDEKREESFATIGSQDIAIDANPAKRGAQSFKLHNYQNTETVAINSVWVRLKKNTGTTTDLQVRIETDNNGKPSGTLADSDATATITAFTSTSYAYYKAAFSSVTLTGNTTYWIIVQHVTEGSGNSQYYWSGHSSGGYAYGNESLYTPGVTSATSAFSPSTTSMTGSPGKVVANTFSVIRDTSGNSLLSSYIQAQLKATDISNLWFNMYRGILQIDTSALPSDAVISSATLSLYCSYKTDSFSQSVGITSSSPASTSTVSSSDYDIANYGSTRFSSDKTLSSITVNAYNDFALNASGINAISLTGYTKMAIRLSADIDNSEPSWSSNGTSTVLFQPYGSNPPRLTITYTTESGISTWTSDTGKDANFLLYAQSDIDAYGDTKAFYLSPQGQEYHLREMNVLANAAGDYSIQVGINTGEYNAFTLQDMQLGANGPVYGDDLVIGESILGNRDKISKRVTFAGIRGVTAKFRFRNRKANQPFKIYSFRTRHEINNKLR